MKTYKCPVCKKPLSRSEYEKALLIEKAKEKHLHERESKLEERFRKKENSLYEQHVQKEKQLKIDQGKMKSRLREANKEGEHKGIQKSGRLIKGLKSQNEKLRDRIRQFEKGTTPHTEGLEFEEILTNRLRRQFPADEIRHTGKGGDILQIAKISGKTAGIIIYECKRTPRILDQHITQAYKAKQTREADFAVLVTTGKKKGFSGFTQIDTVLIVSPLGVIALAMLLRQNLIEMFKAAVTKEQRAIIANRLMQFITSPQFKNPIDEVIEISKKLQAQVQEEATDHYKIWKKRWDCYQTITWDSSQINANLELVLQGKKPEVGKLPKIVPLQIEAPK